MAAEAAHGNMCSKLTLEAAAVFDSYDGVAFFGLVQGLGFDLLVLRMHYVSDVDD